ncbi:hypothetical protein ACFX4N_24070 [Priestia sp. YIM B13551]|uniref:hypothetical protein n=1 Tax=Priestia sp. YIM B13551 TaxID=3366306 RepID=UPI00366E5106
MNNFILEAPYYTEQEVFRKCQQNPWLKIGGVDFEDDVSYDIDSPYLLTIVQTIEELKEKFAQENWSIRTAFAYKQLLFVNQVNAGDEWWTCWKHEDGRIQDFESVSFRRIIKDGEFEQCIEELLQGPDKYWGREKTSH